MVVFAAQAQDGLCVCLGDKKATEAQVLFICVCVCLCMYMCFEASVVETEKRLKHRYCVYVCVCVYVCICVLKRLSWRQKSD
jgi:hypothetical protein